MPASTQAFGIAALLLFAAAPPTPGAPPRAIDGDTRLALVHDGDTFRLEYTLGASAGTVRLHEATSPLGLSGADSVIRSDPIPPTRSGSFVLPAVRSGSGPRFYAITWDASVPNPDAERFAWIPPGSFLLGSPDAEEDRDSDEGPQTAVFLPRGYFLGRHEITQAEYEAVIGSNPSCPPLGPDLPVNHLTWAEAKTYAASREAVDRASGRIPEGFHYALPTEAEWEYAARAGTRTRFSFGDDPGYEHLPDHAWFAGNSDGQPHPVGTLAANPWGLHDLAGNVGEWCADAYGPYLGGQITDPLPATGSFPVSRGGSFEDDAPFCRIAFRNYDWTTNRACSVGLRLALIPSALAQPERPIDLVRIEAGSFLMGSPDDETDREDDEGPPTSVTLTAGFWIGRYEVTQAQFSALMATNPSVHLGSQLPVENVLWEEAAEFCRRLTLRERNARRIGPDLEYRLPTEAEWEYCARAGTRTRFPFGDDPGYQQLPAYAVFLVAPPLGVGSRAPNPWGLHDLPGNVAEWCSDWYGPYADGALTDPAGPGEGFWRVQRGGSFAESGSRCRSAFRGAAFPDERAANVGFRVVLAPVAVPKPFAGLELVRVPAGSFVLGSPESETGEPSDEQPLTPVTISRDFWIGRFEVTQAEYFAVTGLHPSTHLGFPEQPVESVTWDEAMEFCRLLTELERRAGRLPPDRVYRLPTEAEWEYGTRAGTVTRFSFGDDPDRAAIGDYAWYLRNAGATPHPVGRRLANPWGLHDVHGNVSEWCWDWYDTYPGTPQTDPTGPMEGDFHVIRGGSYGNDAVLCRSAFRLIDWTGDRFQDVGFRVVLAHPLPAPR